MLSPRAREIFEKIKTFFPDDSFGNRQWSHDGKLFYNSGWFDLKKADARKFLINCQKSLVGHMVSIRAGEYRKKHGGLLEGFTGERYTRLIQHTVELLLLYEDLDFQIETGDLTD